MYFSVANSVIYVTLMCIVQNCVIPNMLVCMISCGANALLHYGLVYQAKLGIRLVFHFAYTQHTLHFSVYFSFAVVSSVVHFYRILSPLWHTVDC